MLANFVSLIRNCGRLSIGPHCWDLETRCGQIYHLTYIPGKSDVRLADGQEFHLPICYVLDNGCALAVYCSKEFT